MKSSYFAKILLFGEYGIIRDTMGLSIPYRNFWGNLSLPTKDSNENHLRSNHELKKFYNHLQELEIKGSLIASLRLKEFNEDLQNGLYFESTIPQGYGVGSSGALVAAIYDRYSNNQLSLDKNLSPVSIQKVKECLGQMESYFHGKSSGIDPTLCYLQLPLLIRSKTDLGTVVLPSTESNGDGAIFLLNSGIPGETQPMVNLFMEKLKEEGFRSVMSNQFKKYNDACVQAFLKGDWDPLFTNLKSLSNLVLEHFTPMIPNDFHSLWQKGIDNNAYYLKLCGSGGGGYILGFTKNLDKAQKELSPHAMEVVLRF
jgi:mevalonate kinase